MFHLRFGLSDHLKALLDFVFGSRRRVKKVRIFRAWFSQLTTLRRNMQLKSRRHYMHVDGRQETVFTVLRGRLCLMYVMHLSTMTMLPPLAQMPNRDGRTGMKTMLWDINVISNRAGQGIPYSSSWSSTHESFGRFTFLSPPVSPSNDTCRWLFVLVCLLVCLFAFWFAAFVFSCFASHRIKRQALPDVRDDRKNVQLGLRIGQAALIEFELHGQFMKAIWILMNNKLPSQKGGSDPLNRNPFWKFVVPTVSYFAWLRAFCAESLDTSPTRLYADPVQCLADLEGYEGPRGEKFGVPAALGGLTPLGDTRNSQELSVFCQMPKERLRVMG